MHRPVRPLLLTALAFAWHASFATTAEPPPLERLPGWATPESYQLAFKVDPRQQDFSGTTTIKLKLAQSSDHLWLHGHDLQVSKVTITDAAGKSHAASYVVAAAKEGVARIDFDKPLSPQELLLTISYRAPLNQQLQGLYKVSHENLPYAMTQMEAISARYAFPGFDEPSFKTPYQLSLTIPADENAVANTALAQETRTADGWKTLSFAPTRPLPSYLVAFGIGPWDIVNGPDIAADAYRSEPVPLRGIAAKGEGHRMQHVLSETPGIIHALEEYYGFAYPFGKLDLLAAPDFSAGAMENPGLVTFRDWLLLLDADSPARYVRGSFEVTAHELAHQWTGDTVTLAWWNDIWLNEAFATWMQQKITEKIHPEYRADLDRIQGAQGAMNSDSLASARKIRQPITGNGDIETAFDGITYQKGAAVLGMFEAYLGEGRFQQGMRTYIQRHKFGNVTADDLVDVMARTAGKGDDFKRDFKSFLDQSGVPYVHARLRQQDGNSVLELSQSRYLPLGSGADSERLWGVPVCVRYGVAAGSKVSCQMLDQAQGSMVLEGASQPTWVMPNANASGYYRFSMDKASLCLLGKQIGRLADGEQLAYADAIEAGFHHGDLDAADVLAALRPLADSKTGKVAMAPLDAVEWIYQREATSGAQRARLEAWVRQAYLPRLQGLGYTRRNGEPDGDAQWRAELADDLALDFRLPEVRAALLKQGDAALKRGADGRLALAAANPDLLGVALAVSVQERGRPVVEALLAELPNTSDPARRNAMLAGLSHADDPALATQVRDFALQPQVKVGEMATLLRGGRDSAARRDASWQWSVAHYDKIVARTGSFAGGSLPALIGGGGCSQAEADRLSAFFTPRLQDVTGAERGLAQTREATLLCAALKARQDPAAILR